MGGSVCEHNGVQLRWRRDLLRRKVYQFQCFKCHRKVGPKSRENPKSEAVYVPPWIYEKRPNAKRRRYEQHLRSRYWKKIRLEVLQRDDFTCRHCGEAGVNEVDHLNYDSFGHEKKGDLVASCGDCNQARRLRRA